MSIWKRLCACPTAWAGIWSAVMWTVWVTVIAFNDIGESWRLIVRAPQQLAKYVAVKGSITINGVSLTVNQVSGAEFEVNLIPHTLDVTTLNELKVGAKVNLEIDLIARYVERMMTADAG